MIFPRMTPAWSGQDDTHPLPTLHSLSLFLFLGIQEYINYIFYVYINMVTLSCSILQGDGLLKCSELCTVSQNTAVSDSLLATPLPPHQPPPSHLELLVATCALCLTPVQSCVRAVWPAGRNSIEDPGPAPLYQGA